MKYEPVVVDEPVSEAGSHASSNAPTEIGEEVKKAAVVKEHVPKTEDELDTQFFHRFSTKMKLNKGEKRALKFALQKGLDLTAVDDLKSFLASQVPDKSKKATVRSAGGYLAEQANRPYMKTNDWTKLVPQ